MSETKAYMTKKELAGYLGCSVRQIQNWMKSGMPYLRFSDSPQGNIRFRPHEVDEWLNRFKVEGDEVIRRLSPKAREFLEAVR